jgi:hypothetical protein
MSTPSTRTPNVPEPPERPDGDDHSPRVAAWAVLLTVAVLTALVVTLWALRDL